LRRSHGKRIYALAKAGADITIAGVATSTLFVSPEVGVPMAATGVAVAGLGGATSLIGSLEKGAGGRILGALGDRSPFDRSLGEILQSVLEDKILNGLHIEKSLPTLPHGVPDASDKLVDKFAGDDPCQ
jgi:hypothetical protein